MPRRQREMRRWDAAVAATGSRYGDTNVGVFGALAGSTAATIVC